MISLPSSSSSASPSQPQQQQQVFPIPGRRFLPHQMPVYAPRIEPPDTIKVMATVEGPLSGLRVAMEGKKRIKVGELISRKNDTYYICIIITVTRWSYKISTWRSGQEEMLEFVAILPVSLKLLINIGILHWATWMKYFVGEEGQSLSLNLIIVSEIEIIDANIE